MKKSIIEKIAEGIGVIPKLQENHQEVPEGMKVDSLSSCPPVSEWDDWVEYEAKSWPKKDEKHYSIVPTTCFNCEAACGLLAFIDKGDNSIRKLQGNPHHPSSRGRNCAKGPATINQVTDPDRILYPLKRKGERGSGEWERISWDQALDEISAKLRSTLEQKKVNEVIYHVGRPGHEGYMERVLKAWGVDGHNSHTSICSGGARTGYTLWHHFDRPSPDFSNAKFILLLSAHLESGHYFNPHAQRIMEAKMAGAKLAVFDPRLSNSASMADIWVSTYPGSEAAILLAIARVMLQEKLYNRDYVENWVNWKDYLKAEAPDSPVTFEAFIEKLIDVYAEFTPEFAAQEAGIDPEVVFTIAREIGKAGSAFSAHTWRSAAQGNLGGWQVARSLHFLSVLAGAVGTEGGTLPNGWNKFKPTFFDNPAPAKTWNTLNYSDEYPLAQGEQSHILPHFLKQGRGKISVYFSRVFNPVWTYPDGFTWVEALNDLEKIGCHVALTPTWNETAIFADYVLPMGHAPERHDFNSYETYSGQWIAFRQPVLRVKAERDGKDIEFTYQANPGEVWEEDEFWIELSWRIDPDGSLGIREHFISPYREGEKITINEFYQYIFEHIPGLPEKAKSEGMNPLEFMKRYGAFEVKNSNYLLNEKELSQSDLQGTETNPETGLITKGGNAVGIHRNGKNMGGFPTQTRLQEFYAPVMKEWGWPEYTIPGYIKSQIHPDKLDKSKNEYCLLPTFRLPVHIHSRSANAKWLTEIAHRNPIWINPIDAEKFGVQNNDMLKIKTGIGYFVDKVWVTESIKPGVVACSHHIGRWRREQDQKGNRWMTNTVKIEEKEKGQWSISTLKGVEPFESSDPDSSRIFYRDGGVHQNITHVSQPDPISGMHCWHQKVSIEKAGPNDKYGDVFVDTNKSFELFKEWNAMTRKPDREDGLRRPLDMHRTLKPATEAYYKK